MKDQRLSLKERGLIKSIVPPVLSGPYENSDFV